MTDAVSAATPGEAIERPRRVVEIRAAHAATRILAIEKEVLGDYRTIARKLPALLRTSGLTHVLRFLGAKRESRAQGLLLTHLEEWLTSADAPIAWPDPEDGRKVFDRLVTGSDDLLYQAAGEAILYAGWLKYLAEDRAIELKVR